ncbi:MAG: flavin reductase family protein [Bdellovibrionota bacterium]
MSKSPNPNWKLGDKIEVPIFEMQTLTPNEMEVKDVYKLLIGSVVPRPIAFVSTISKDAVVNLAPFSFFNAVCSNPPTLMLALSKKPISNKNKDTAQNILDTKEFVVNIASDWLIEPLVHTAGGFAEEVNEMEVAGLTPLASEVVKPPRVKESPIHFECKLEKTINLGEGELGSTTVFFGKIVKAHIIKDAYDNGRVDFNKIRAVGRLGGFQYGLINEIFELKPPVV